MAQAQRFFIMKQNSAYATGRELCGTAIGLPAAKAMQEAHTARMQNGKIHSKPIIMTEPEYDEWQANHGGI